MRSQNRIYSGPSLLGHNPRYLGEAGKGSAALEGQGQTGELAGQVQTVYQMPLHLAGQFSRLADLQLALGADLYQCLNAKIYTAAPADSEKIDKTCKLLRNTLRVSRADVKGDWKFSLYCQKLGLTTERDWRGEE